jgi:curved DNA-binding protein
MEYKDYYKILGVAKDAGQDDIHRAYRKLARKFHPDVSKESDADEKFREINEAKEVLKDPEKRKLYDMYGKDWENGGQQPPPGWNRGTGNDGKYHYQTYRHSNRTDEFRESSDFSDFFNNLFGSRDTREPSGARYEHFFSAAGNSHEAEIEVELPEAFSGTTRIFSFRVFEAGVDGKAIPKEKTLQVKIPKGVTNGSIIRLAGQGEKGFGGGKDGDLLLRISIVPDRRFHVVGHNLHTTVSVSPWEAALGAKIPVKTVNGTVNLSIPAGTQNGKRFRLRGLGIPKKGVSAGDIFIEIDIRVPQSLTDKEKQLFEKLSDISEFNPREERKQRAKQYEKI